MIYRLLMLFVILTCREEEIRTLDAVTHILPFQGSSFNHSDTSLCGFKGANIAFLLLHASDDCLQILNTGN